MATRTWATAALTATLLAACAAPETAPDTTAPETAAPHSTSSAPDQATITWVDGVCQAQQLLVWNQPPPVPNPVTEADRPAVVAYLTDVRNRFTQATTLIDGLDPTPAGEQVVRHLRTVLGEQADAFAEHVQHAQMFPAPEFGAPYRLAQMDLASWTVGSPSLTDLATSNPTVAAAQRQAPNC
jgi:hypothetical protein